MKLKAYLNNWKIALAACLTIGLAPWYPQPHIIGKIRWIMGGAVDMGWIDWADFVFHLLPWIWLVWVLNKRL